MINFNKILIANRGEIASRILRTLNKMKIANVVVHHPIDAATPSVKMAAETVVIDGPTPVAAYLDEAQIISVSGKIEKMGNHGSHTGELIFNDCRVDKKNVLGKINEGIHVMMTGLDFERVAVAGIALGISDENNATR